MRGRALFLPVFTAAAVLLAVSLPMGHTAAMGS